MGGSIFLVATVVLLAAVAVGVLAAVSTPRPAPTAGLEPATASAPIGSPAAMAARRHMNTATVLAWLGFAFASVLAWVLILSTGRAAGMVAALAPAALGTVFLLVHLLGELTWPRPDGAVRRAVLAPRSTRQVVGTWLAGWSAAVGLLLVALLVTGGLTADETGRSVSWTSPTGDAAGSAGPYPGWPFAGPLLVATALVAALTVLVIRLVVQRAAVADTHPLDDLALRRSSVRRVLAGVQLVLGLTAAGVLLVAAGSLSSLGRSAQEMSGGVSGRTLAMVGSTGIWAALLLGLASAVVAVVALARSGAPALPVPDQGAVAQGGPGPDGGAR
jgi:hypothetical protein